ncbi:hypothetical protein ENUP19_0050G0015 [Entamoeba nuttalli]|uniref:Protein kinase domain-containing protein n=1 Tax=Entamoeba nuttalli TaxID=412467 RepID=A0ABQ0DBL2_9EUKA
MVPEILNLEHYKMQSDIYSFSITMLQFITWQDPFPKILYQHPLDIADTITIGKQPNIIQEVEEDIKEIIEKSWEQELNKRLIIEACVRMLEILENT